MFLCKYALPFCINLLLLYKFLEPSALGIRVAIQNVAVGQLFWSIVVRHNMVTFA